MTRMNEVASRCLAVVGCVMVWGCGEPGDSCENAIDLGWVDGDAGNADGSLGTTGVGSTWFNIGVRETVGGFSSNSLSYVLALHPPEGERYALEVLHAPVDEGPTCDGEPRPSEENEGVITVRGCWSEGFFAADDDRWLTVFVHRLDGSAEGGGEWSLDAAGNIGCM